MTPPKQRLIFFISMAVAVSFAVTLVLMNLKDHLIYFYTPSDLTSHHYKSLKPLRLGGLVEKNSYSLKPNSSPIPCHEFIVTDDLKTIKVQYQGLLPSLFREGQGVIVEGIFNDIHFQAQKVLAKHDETYMPPQVAKSLDQSHKALASQSVIPQ